MNPFWGFLMTLDLFSTSYKIMTSKNGKYVLPDSTQEYITQTQHKPQSSQSQLYNLAEPCLLDHALPLSSLGRARPQTLF